MKQSDIEKEVFEYIEKAIEDGKEIPPYWLTTAIIDRHQSIDGEDAPWYHICALEHIRDVVRQGLRRYKIEPTEKPDPQLTLPGFKRIQKVYLIERDGQQVGIPVHLLSAEQVAQKIGELRAMGQGCFEHADELARWQRDRLAA